MKRQAADNPVVIYDHRGDPLKPARTSALAGGSGSYNGPPYDAADIYGQHMAAWSPYLWSPDAELNMYRDRIVARVRDLVRNDGWAAGTVTRILDNVIGPNLRPISKPDHKYLALVTGNKAFDMQWAKEFGSAVDTYWRSWANGDGFYCDAGRSQDFSQMMYVNFRHKLVDGDALAVLLWLEDRLGYGRARYATTVQLVDPDRLSNPQQVFDTQTMRGGVKVDKHGAAVAYYIRRAHFGDWWSAADSMTWDLIPRETPWGRPRVVHDFDADRASQHRGGAGIFTPVMQRLKMLIKYDGVELDSAIINAIFAAYIESPFDHSLIEEAISDGERLNAYQEMRKEFHDERRMVVGNARIPIMFPGERINAVAPNRPISNFKDFENACLRNVATGAGVSAQQVTNDWSDVNYSSARAALLEAWKTFTRRKHAFTVHHCSPIRSAWLEESFAVDDLPLPNSAPDYPECRAAYSRCQWMGPGRGWVDPVAEKQGAVLGMQAGLSTLQHECAEQGEDYEEVLEQRSYEISLFRKYDMELPDWTGEKKGQSESKRGGQLPDKPQKPGKAPNK